MRLIGRKTLAPLVVFLAVVLAGSWASAEASDLPRCPEGQNKRFHNCFGTVTWPDDSKYVGEFRANEFHGQGTYTWADGDKYVGEWRDNNRHGQGTYTYANGTIKKGIWENDKYQGTKKEYEEILKKRKRAAEKLKAEKRAAKLAAEKHKAELEAALARCLYEDLDKIVSDAAGKIVTKKCKLELQDLSTEDLMEAYD